MEAHTATGHPLCVGRNVATSRQPAIKQSGGWGLTEPERLALGRNGQFSVPPGACGHGHLAMPGAELPWGYPQHAKHDLCAIASPPRRGQLPLGAQVWTAKNYILFEFVTKEEKKQIKLRRKTREREKPKRLPPKKLNWLIVGFWRLKILRACWDQIFKGTRL